MNQTPSGSKIITIKKPESIQGLDKNAADLWWRSKVSVLPLLESAILHPFEERLKEKTGFSEINRPATKVENEYLIDSIKFSVTTTPTTKKIEYEKLYHNLIDYLNYLKGEKERIGRIKGISLIEGEIYLELDVILDKIQELQTTAKEGKEGIKQEVSFDEEKLPNDIAMAERVTVDLDSEIHPDIPGNGRIYVLASKIESYYNDIVERFEGYLKERTGYSKDKIPDETKRIKILDIPDYMFFINVIPYDSPSYSGIIKSLTYETNKLTSKTGILVRAKMNPDDPMTKGIAKKKNEKIFVAIDRLLGVIDDIRKENTEKKVKFKIQPVPSVW